MFDQDSLPNTVLQSLSLQSPYQYFKAHSAEKNLLI